MEKQGTCVSITGVEDQDTSEKIKDFLYLSSIPYDRAIPLLDQQELLLQMSNFDDVNTAFGFLKDKGVRSAKKTNEA